MTAVLDDAVELDPAPQEPPASWGARAAAFGIDVLFGVVLIVILAMLAWAAPFLGALWWVYTALAVLTGLILMGNRWVLPVRTGWTAGRAVTGIRVFRTSGDQNPPDTGRLMVRDVAHLLDTVPLLAGWLWPLLDRRRRTFADLLLRTEVRRVGEPDRDVRRPVAIGLIGVALVCVGAATAGYFVVYRGDRALEDARGQIAAQGAGIVEKMLSYNPDTADQDFERARALAADSYRPQLIAQQDALRKAPLVSNEYWSVNSAVLESPPPTTTTASMLLAMQGQRGSNPGAMRFITATVRVDFVKSGEQWQVQNLSVLTRPQMQASGG
ncbi:RDD family protein [Mycolicibacterium neoaurum]|uniref:RDD family protein n=1 Tax=Mycolicibacterium neoaurum TaxID=1795 RepID=UPI0026724AFD|nr:RDD family protein [Mycolicibacterium neoaurum]MDO3401174.1 RDD family protein [Mycolicibacterium neoaurum]